MYKKYAGITTDLHPNVTVVVTDVASANKFIVEPAGEKTYRIFVHSGADKLYLYLSPDWAHSPKVALVSEADAKDSFWYIQALN